MKIPFCCSTCKLPYEVFTRQCFKTCGIPSTAALTLLLPFYIIYIYLFKIVQKPNCLIAAATFILSFITIRWQPWDKRGLVDYSFCSRGCFCPTRACRTQWLLDEANERLGSLSGTRRQRFNKFIINRSWNKKAMIHNMFSHCHLQGDNNFVNGATTPKPWRTEVRVNGNFCSKIFLLR